MTSEPHGLYILSSNEKSHQSRHHCGPRIYVGTRVFSDGSVTNLQFNSRQVTGSLGTLKFLIS